MKHHAFSTEEEATEALCDFRDHGNTLETELACEKENRNHLIEKGAKLETELAAAKAECKRLYESSPTALDALTAELTRLRAEAALTEAIDGVIDGGSIPDTLLVVHVPRSPVG